MIDLDYMWGSIYLVSEFRALACCHVDDEDNEDGHVVVMYLPSWVPHVPISGHCSLKHSNLEDSV